MKTAEPYHCLTLVYTMIFALMPSSYGQLVCPPPSQVYPCTCTNYNPGLGIFCDSLNMNDLQMSNVLNAFLSPDVSPVVSFSAYNNLLMKIPSQIANFTQLNQVQLSGNQITSIPTGAFNFSQSTSSKFYLYLFQNKISTVQTEAFIFPPSLYNSSISINLANNELTAMLPKSAIVSQSSILYFSLNLNSNKITAIPQKSLNFLSLTSGSGILLDFGYNQITSIPLNTFTFPLSSFIYITLSYNKITAVPKGAFSFSSSSLYSISLDFSGNLIPTLPNGVFNFTTLSSAQLSMRGNLLSTVSSNAFVLQSPIISFDLSRNKIKTLTPGAFNFLSSATSYIYLTLDGNQITEIPSGVLNFSRAAQINFELSNNSIASISSTAFNLLPASYYIGLSMNQISTLAPGTFAVSSPNAANSNYNSFQLCLGANQLTAIPSSAFNFPSSLSSLYLDFSNNKIKSIPFGTFNFLPPVSKLSLLLAGNQLTTVPSGIFTFKGTAPPNGLPKFIQNLMKNTKPDGSSELNPFPNLFLSSPNKRTSKGMGVPLLPPNFIQEVKPNSLMLNTAPPRNRISKLEASCSSVNIDLSSNSLTTIPWSAFNFTSPSSYLSVDFSGNQISTISSSGSFNFVSATPAVYIMLNNNLIKTLPPGVFNFLSNATSVSLSLSSNLITSVQPGVFAFLSLTESVFLSLDNNLISSIPLNTFDFSNARIIFIYLSGNRISSILPGTFKFTSPGFVVISLSGNLLTSVLSETFNFSFSYATLSLSHNQITTIESGAFQSNYGNIYLGYNGLTRFDSQVFKATLQRMSNQYQFVEITEDPIDCSSDPCALAWLIRDNRQLLANVQNATCSNGTDFANLSPYGYADCPVIC